MQSKKKHFTLTGQFAFTVFAVLMWAAAKPAVAQTYTVTNLGTLGGASSWAYGVNNSGQVTGTALLANGSARAFRWTNGVMQNLGTLRNYTYSQGRAINGLGYVAGWGGGTLPHALLWDASGKAQDIVGGSNQSQAYGINDAAQVVSVIFSSAGERVFLSTIVNNKRKLFDIGPGQGRGINASGQVTGYDGNQGFLWTPSTPNGTSGTRIYIGNFGGSYSYPRGINDLSEVVGDAGVLIGGLTYSRAFLYSGGVMSNLGTLPGGYNSVANAVNNLGDVVGRADNSNGEERAFLYRGGVMSDLNDLIPVGSDWVLQEATGINDAGQIVGIGTHNGQTRAFLLTP